MARKKSKKSKKSASKPARKSKKSSKKSSRKSKSKSKKSSKKKSKSKSKKPHATTHLFVFRGVTDKGNPSFKTWAVVVHGNSYTARCGKAFGKKQTQTKNFKSRETMGKALLKLVRSKIKKGYCPVAACR